MDRKGMKRVYKEKIKNYLQENIKDYIEFFIFYLIVFAIMLNRHYSIDAYSYSRHYKTVYDGNLSLGRIGNYFVFGLFKNINIVTHQRFFTVVFIFVLAVVSCMLYIHIKQHMEGIQYNIILKMSIIIVFCNVFMMDFFVYIEMVLAWCCGITLMALAVMQINHKMTVKNWIVMLLFMIMSLSFYQALIGFFVYFALIDVYTLYNGKLTKQSFFDSFKILFCGGVAGVFNILLLKILQKIGIAGTESRTESVGLQGMLANVRGILAGIKSLFRDTSGFMPAHMVLIVLILLYIMILVTLIRNHASGGQYLYIILLILSTRVVLYMPHMLASTVWMAPRSIISYWTIISMPCIILLALNENRLCQYINGIMLAIVLITNIINVQMISESVIATNRLDEEIAYMIQKKIDDYQEETGQLVDTIIFRNDNAPCWKYRTVEFQRFELCERIYNVPWGCVEAINYYNNKDYMFILMDDDTFGTLFEKDNWDELNLNEQMIFQGNVLYFVAY